MQEFFLDGDTSQEPQVSKASDKSWILNEVGLCLMNLGRLNEAVPFYERAVVMRLDLEDRPNASAGYRNLANLYFQFGALEAGAAAAHEALVLARRAEDKRGEAISLEWQAWAAHLRGDLEMASETFAQAEALEREIASDIQYIYSVNGIQHAEHLRRTNDAVYARRVTDANLEICERNHWVKSISMCYRVLGDLDAESGHRDDVRQHYDEALKIARSISYRPALIEALLAQGALVCAAWAGRGGGLCGFTRGIGIRVKWRLPHL